MTDLCMKALEHTVGIQAPKEKVWKTLWSDATFRDWANLIDEGTYMKGTLKEGQPIEFISAVNGFGVTSLVEKLIPNEHISFRHSSDTQQAGANKRDNEWTGAIESYSLSEKNGVTTLTLINEVPPEQERTFTERLPKALKRIKKLAEK